MRISVRTRPERPTYEPTAHARPRMCATPNKELSVLLGLGLVSTVQRNVEASAVGAIAAATTASAAATHRLGLPRIAHKPPNQPGG